METETPVLSIIEIKKGEAVNTFDLFIKQGAVYMPISGTPVFPFSIGELLDERLDEAYVTVYGCVENSFKPLTEVKITVNDGKNTDYFFIVASDHSTEFPVGSAKYKHELYLIERTKLLEGTICPTLTFTNSFGNTYTNNQMNVIANGENAVSPFSKLSDWIGTNPFSINSIKTPVAAGEDIELPSPKEVGEKISERMQDYGGTYYSKFEPIEATNFNSIQYYSKVDVTYYDSTGSDVRISTKDYTEKVIVNSYGDITSKYLIIIQLSDISAGPQGSVMFIVNFVQAAVENKYPLKPWTITDCFVRVLECANPLFKTGGNAIPSITFDGVSYDENGTAVYEAGSTAEKLNKITAPEFTLTQDTLREQLKVIASKVHAEPFLDENNVIKLLDYGAQKSSSAEDRAYYFKSSSININNYCTEVRSNAQNLVSSLNYARGVMIDPAIGLYRSLRTENAYVRINEGNGIVETNKPIYSIKSLKAGLLNKNGSSTWFVEPQDITPYVFEATEYSANLNDQTGGYPYSKSYALYYTQGQKNIYGLFYRATEAESSAVYGKFAIANILQAVTNRDVSDYIDENREMLVFQVSYKPISNHFVSHGKQLYILNEPQFSQIYNQSENLTESDYFGENIKGVAARLGNVEEERTYYIPSVSNIPKVGEMIDGFAISSVSTEIMPYFIKCTVGLTKDFNRISQYVGINSAKRMYEVSERQAYQRDILLREILLIDNGYAGDASTSGWFKIAPYAKLFNGNDHSDKVSSLRVTSKSNSNGATAFSTVTLPVISRALGNVAAFTATFKDNYSAGSTVVEINDRAGISGYWQNELRYTDYYGRVYWASLALKSGEVKAKNPKEYPLDIPEDAEGETLTESSFAAIINDYRLRKDNREIPSFNIELEAKTTLPDINIGSAIASLSPYVTDVNSGSLELIFYDKSSNNVTKFDQYYTGDGIEGSILSALTDKDVLLTITLVAPNDDVISSDYGWLIRTQVQSTTLKVENENGEVEEIVEQTGGEILLSSNDASIGFKQSGTSYRRSLYLYTKRI